MRTCVRLLSGRGELVPHSRVVQQSSLLLAERKKYPSEPWNSAARPLRPPGQILNNQPPGERRLEFPVETAAESGPSTQWSLCVSFSSSIVRHRQ